MAEKEFINWIQKNNLIEISKHYKNCFKTVLKQCLNTKDEQLLIIGDRGIENNRISPIITMSYYLAAKDLHINAELVVKDGLTLQTNNEVILQALSDLEHNSVIVISLTEGIGNIGQLGKSFRAYSAKNKHRFTSICDLKRLKNGHLKNLIASIDVDYSKMKLVGQNLKKIIDNGKMLHITTDKGTDLYFDIKHRKSIANIGDYSLPGSGGNMPCGEVYIPPKSKDKVFGEVVIDGSIRTHKGTFLVKNPVKLCIENGEVTRITGFKEAKLLEESLKREFLKSKCSWGVRRISELGIGINPNANIVGSTIIDEKTIGTAHVAIGSNDWFGGSIYATNHFDQVFKNPTIYIDDEQVRIQTKHI